MTNARQLWSPGAPRVQLAHGAGGPLMRRLIDEVFLSGVASSEARALGDGAAIAWGDEWLVVTTDAHVVSPLEFPGGDIGRLAVSGVVNDLAMMGATRVLALSAAFVLEEGMPIGLIERVHHSMLQTSREAGAPILTGDTKVMGKGELDGMIITTTGLGVTRRLVRDSGMVAGDALVVTGDVGDHGLAVLSARHGLGLGGDLRSDVAPIGSLIELALSAAGTAVHAMKDPTRGGLVSALVEMATKAQVSVQLELERIPVSAAARAASELLGIDPLVVANEGKALIAVAPEGLEPLLGALRGHPLGRQAACIGHVTAGNSGVVLLDTGFGVRRLREPEGEPLPRIC